MLTPIKMARQIVAIGQQPTLNAPLPKDQVLPNNVQQIVLKGQVLQNKIITAAALQDKAIIVVALQGRIITVVALQGRVTIAVAPHQGTEVVVGQEPEVVDDDSFSSQS